MIVRLNGVYWYDMDEKMNENNDHIIIPSVRKTINPKLKTMSIALWTLSASFVTKSTLAAGSFYEEMQPLNHVFQDIALGLGSLAILAGFVLLIVRKRWGKMTLKMTAIIIVGVFLAPSALMLLAIIGTEMNDALWHAFNNVRDSNVKEVMGQ